MNCSIEKQREVFAEISAAEVGFIMGKKLQKCNFFSTQLLNSITNFRSIEKKTLKLGPQNLKFVLKTGNLYYLKNKREAKSTWTTPKNLPRGKHLLFKDELPCKRDISQECSFISCMSWVLVFILTVTTVSRNRIIEEGLQRWWRKWRRWWKHKVPCQSGWCNGWIED